MLVGVLGKRTNDYFGLIRQGQHIPNIMASACVCKLFGERFHRLPFPNLG